MTLHVLLHRVLSLVHGVIVCKPLDGVALTWSDLAPM